MPHKCGDLSSEAQDPWKSQTWLHVAATPVLGSGNRDRQMPGLHWAASPVKAANPRIGERCSLKRWGGWKSTPNVNLWPLCAHTHTLASTPSHTCTHAYTQRQRGRKRKIDRYP